MGDRLYQPSDARVFSAPDRAILALAKAPYARTSQHAGWGFGYYEQNVRGNSIEPKIGSLGGYKRSS
jgi:hypothetical protein